ncbi:MAG: CBS domain-containing protein [Planctomycetes bacterium]|nr:CBS domain-containing protein [Planctomycetota bacterium]
MFKASTIMTTDVICVNKQTGIYKAIESMVENNITGLPVVNDDMTLAGIISEKDVLSLLYNMEDRPDTVEHYMTLNPICFDADDSLIEIAECFIKNNFRRVPIISDGKLAGIVSRKDIIAYILKLRHKDNVSAECIHIQS